MANIFDYLSWRGDLTFKQVPFNPVDNLICALLSYLPFDGILPGPGEKAIITIGEAADRFAALHRERPSAVEPWLLDKEDPAFLSALGNCKRYRNLRIGGYVNHIDVSREIQFSALTIFIDKVSAFIAYRGTDNTLVGWKEDFNMSFSRAVPAQLEAVTYLETMARHIPRARLRPTVRLGGHSKGGNLGIYAASYCSKRTQRRIGRVYSNDGPGFSPEVINSEGYQAIRERIESYVPQSSVIGMLFEHEDDYTVVKSSQTGLMQHSLYSWEVSHDDVIRLDRVTQGSRFIDRTLKEWIGGMDREQRRRFAEALFELLNTTEARSVPELTASWLKNARIMIQSLNTVDETTKAVISKTISALFKAVRNNITLLMSRK